MAESFEYQWMCWHKSWDYTVLAQLSGGVDYDPHGEPPEVCTPDNPHTGEWGTCQWRLPMEYHYRKAERLANRGVRR